MSPMSILVRKTRDLQIAEINLLIWLIGLLFENFKDTDESYDSFRFVLSYFHDVQKFHVLPPQCKFFSLCQILLLNSILAILAYIIFEIGRFESL